MKKRLIKEAFRLQQIAGILPVNEMFENNNPDALRLGEDTIKKYFETMVEAQPDTVVDILSQLLTEKLPFGQFLQATVEDIQDSYRDELGESGDPDLDDDPNFWNLSNDEWDAIDAGADPDEVRYDKYNDPDARRDAKYNR